MADQQATLEVLTRIDSAIADFNRLQGEAVQTLDRIEAETRGAGEGMEKLGKQVSKTKDTINLLRDAFAALQIGRFVKGSVDAGIAIDNLNRRLGANNFEFVRQEADRLGIQITALGESFARFEAATRGTALQGAAARDIFISVTEALTAVGASSAQVQGALTALEQIVSKGRVSAEELRGQLGERIPGAFRLAAESIGVTTAELDKMLETGALTADELLPRFAARLREEFVPALDTTERNIQRVQSQITLLQAAFAAGFSDELNRGLGQAAGSARELEEAARGVGSALGFLGTFVARLSQLLVGGLSVALAQAVDVVSSATEGLLRMSRAVTGLIPGFSGLNDELDAAIKKAEDWDAAVEGFIESSADDAKKGLEGLRDLFAGTGDAAEQAAEQTERQAEATRDTTEATDEATEAQETLATALREKTAAAVDEATKSLEAFEKQIGDTNKRIADLAKEARDSAKKTDRAPGGGDETTEQVTETSRSVEDLRREVEALTDAQANNLVVTEEQFTTLQQRTSELAEAERQLAQERQASDQVFFEGQQTAVAGQEEINALLEGARSEISQLSDAYGEQGNVATSSLESIVNSFENVTSQIGVTGEDIATFQRNFQQELERLGQQAERDLGKVREETEGVKDETKELTDEIEELGTTGAENLKLTAEEMRQLHDVSSETLAVCKQLAECLATLGSI